MTLVLAPVCATASRHVSKTGTGLFSAVWPPLARRHAGDDVGAVVLHLLGVEAALAAGDALDEESRVRPDEDAHAPLARCGHGHDPSRRPRRACAAVWRSGSPASLRMRAACSALVPTMRTTIGTWRSCWRRASTRPCATSSPRAMPPKMLTRIARTLVVGEDQAHRRGDLVVLGAAADVEEVGRLAAGALDEVHGRHRQPGAVDHAADRAVEA